ncbi:MAG: translation initiation factor IF-2 [Bacteroidia bacterium]
MAETNPPKRLNKVAKELNVSVSTIVEFLASKGHNIDPNPNSKVEENIYNLLLDEFQAEKSEKEKSLKVSIGKERRETISIEETHKTKAKKEDDIIEKDEIIIKTVTVEPEDFNKEEIKINIPEPKQPTVVGKIDLGLLNKSKKGAKKKEEEPKVEEKPKEIEKKEVSEEKVETPKAVEESHQNAENKEELKTTDTAPVASTEDFLETKVQKLEGPTIVGKIDLPVKEEKKKPIASSNTETERGKKKRKRIRKEPINPNSVQVNSGNNQRKENKNRHEKGGKTQPKPELTEEEIQAQIKETLARLAGKSKGSKHSKEKREKIRERLEEESERKEAEKKILKVTEFITANQMASMMNINVTEIIKACMNLGLFVSINQRLDAETMSFVAEEFGYKLEFVSVEAQENIEEEKDNPEDLVERAPIVTVMGHVDHGKSSLIDYIRNSNIVAGEAGGITQHIGAYSVKLDNGKSITFLDTPGHEAFTAMRARGAKLTDIAIIVVSADDRVMPQTKEAINHAQAAGVPIVFAINKIDKPDANPNKIKEELANMNFLVEEWGGKYQSQDISAKMGINVDLLLDKVLLEAELLELKANPKRRAVGTVVESSLDKGRGYVATVLVQNGTLRIGDIMLAGAHSGRVKAMFNERGQHVKEAGPSTPVLVLGLDGAPQAGDKFNVMTDEREAREIATKRGQLIREQSFRAHKHITLDEIGRRLAIGDFKELNVIVKGDVDGSVEALSDSLLKLSTDKISVRIIHKGVGAISESDVTLASASDAIIIGFQVRPSANARKLAEQEQIDIRLYSIIYDAINEVKAAMEGMLAPEYEEKIVCNVEVREVFKISKVGTVAGCYVTDGKISRNTKVRIIRDGIVIHTGELGSLKRFKDDVKEVAKGFECGLNIHNFNDIKVGDIIEGYELVQVKPKL